MVIRNYNKKSYVELNDVKLTFYKKFRTKEYDVKDIKAAYLDDNYIFKMLYKNKVVTHNIVNTLSEDKYLVEALLLELNKEKNIFYSSYYQDARGVGYAWLVMAIVNIIQSRNSWIGILFWSVLLICSISLILGKSYDGKIFLYKTTKKSIFIGSKLDKKIDEFNINTNFSFDFKNSGNCYVLKNVKKKMYIINNVIYPRYYKEELENLYKSKAC